MKRSTTRRRLLSWLPISIVALICIGVVVATLAMANSWWTDPDHSPSADQVAADGMSLFTTSGVDYLTRQGTVKLRLTGDALPATEIGLESDAQHEFEPLVPIDAVVLSEDGAIRVNPVRSFTITTAGDHVQSITIERETNGHWLSALPDLRRMATQWGWTAQDIDQLVNDLTEASREQGGDLYSANLPPIEHDGLRVEVAVDVNVPNSTVTLHVTVSRP